MKSISKLAFTASALTGVVRVALGVLWLNEGLLKFHAHFGAADILLVADSAHSNTRVPWFFDDFAQVVLKGAPDLLGAVMPLLEVGLGIALILGILTLPAGLGAVFTLMTYWMADQLIAAYPIMVLLAVVVVTWHTAAARFSLASVLKSKTGDSTALGSLVHGPLSAWL